MAYALIIKDENNCTIIEHVANYSDDTVYTPDYVELGLPSSEWRKAHHLTNWIGLNRPHWQIFSREFDVKASLFQGC